MTDATMNGCDIPPTTDSILAEINRENVTWEHALGDLIDNALDANANRVVIEVDTKAKRVTVRDNGDGCDEPHRMLQQGYSTKRGKRNMLGRYGVGLKHASYWFCADMGRTVIVSCAKGQRRRVRVCWGDVIRSGSWRIPPVEDLTESEALPDLLDGRGTSVTFNGSRRRWLNVPDASKLFERFGFMFSPALRAGRQIEIVVDGKRRTLAAATDPTWSESVRHEIVVGHRKASVRAGIKAANDTSGMSGMSYTYGHRVIISNESDGLGDYSRHGFAGIVDLDEHWVLGQNKMSVTDDAWERLCGEILNLIRPMLEKLKNSSMALRCDALRANVSSILNGIVAAKKPSGWHRKKGGPPRGVKADGQRPGRRGGSIKVDFFNDIDDRRAGFVESSGMCVQINAAKPLIADALERGDHTFIALMAHGLWSNSDAKQHLFPENKRAHYEELMGDFCDREVQMVPSVASA